MLKYHESNVMFGHAFDWSLRYQDSKRLARFLPDMGITVVRQYIFWFQLYGIHVFNNYK